MNDTLRKSISYCLFPFSMWYGIGIFFRNMAFEIGLKKQTAPHVTTIGLGNLACGGTGKTPHAEHLITLLQNDYRVAYLSRGYKRESKGFQIASEGCDARLLGDEASMIARKFPKIMVAVCEKRVEGVRRLMEMEQPPQVIILDDVYQHRSIKPTINILLTEYQNPYFKDHILPFGNLREFRSARSRANIIIVTKTPSNIDPISKHNIINELGAQAYQKVFFSSIGYQQPRQLYGNESTQLNNYENILLVTGIAHPEPLEKHVSRYSKVKTMAFGDHHEFSDGELQQIAANFAEMGERSIVLTTEKDAQRLRSERAYSILGNLPIYYIPIGTVIEGNKDFNFDSTIQKSVKENITFLDKLEHSHFLM